MSADFPEAFAILGRAVVGQDDDGNDVYGTAETTTMGAFAPAGSSELTQGQDTVLEHPVIYLLPNQPVPAATDKIRARGEVYDVDGEPAVYTSPYSGKSRAAVKLLGVT